MCYNSAIPYMGNYQKNYVIFQKANKKQLCNSNPFLALQTWLLSRILIFSIHAKHLIRLVTKLFLKKGYNFIMRCEVADYSPDS